MPSGTSREISQSDHATVTAADHYGPMLSARRYGDPGRAGALILRVWLEGSGGDPQLRVRMIGRPDLDWGAQDTQAAASTIEETLAYVRTWLERFTVSGQSGSA
jgi:hypothetical protein